MNPFSASWDILGISLVLSLRFLGPFAFGVSLIVWAALRPRSGTRKRSSFLGVALGILICLAPLLVLLISDTG